MDYFNAFWVGGLICALVQILLDKTKLLPGRVMVLLVCSGAVLSFLGFYQPFTEYAGAGASVPLLGFRQKKDIFFRKNSVYDVSPHHGEPGPYINENFSYLQN